jgi:hypothetical protein
MKTRVAWLGVSILVAAAGAGLLTGCGETKAEPLDVSYYYLPG